MVSTPKPPSAQWIACISPDDTLYIDDGKRPIATLLRNGITAIENAANARLIAASPAMFDVINEYLAADTPLKLADAHKRAHEVLAKIQK